jgi:hypothetical protein
VEVRAHNACGWSDWKWLDAVYNPCGSSYYYSMSVGPSPADATLTVDITALADETGNVLQQLPAGAPASGNGGNVVAQPQPDPVYEIKLFNSMGVLVLQTTAPAGSNPLNVSGLPNGLYILHVYDGSNSPPQTQNIIISH